MTDFWADDGIHGTEGEDLLRLASADNFRDVAGTGYATVDGARMRRGVFYRSNELQLSDEDHSTLSALGLTAVLDLRTQGEIDRHPDAEIPGAQWHHFDVIGIPMEEVAGLKSREAAIDVMHWVYTGFVEVESSRRAYGELFRQLATGGPQLFHCTAGKDRTGWAAALLQHIAGVDDATIESDYLLTNAFAGASRAAVESAIREHLGEDGVRVLEPTLVVDTGYLRSAYASVEKLYGDREAYLREGLGLDDGTISALRELLRVT
jgi:protein-tyrosine phosphatase